MDLKGMDVPGDRPEFPVVHMLRGYTSKEFLPLTLGIR